MNEQTSTWLPHLLEIRRRLLWTFGVIGVLFLGLFYFANTLYDWLAAPLLHFLPTGHLIATQVAAPFLTPMKLSGLCALLLGIPVLLYQVWAFVAPGLYPNERRLWPVLLICSALLFYAGIAFAYFLVLPLVFGFFVQAAPINVAVMTDMSAYLDFVTRLLFGFGMAFEVPIITFVLAHSGIVTVGTLKKQRPYIIIGAFTLGMLLTPPDVFSQTLLALPMWGLFELGVWMAAKNKST